MNLADKLKALRKAKNVSQEKIAEYLGVSYQAVSKWENGVTSPDISLLPAIARYFGITVDELLQVEQIQADKYFEECSLKAERLFRDGKRAEVIPLWLEAYKRMPNDIRVKEMLMSIYFDTDKIKYQNEIIELGTEIYNSAANDKDGSYYRGQAVMEVAQTYSANGNEQKANDWARKAFQINHCQEMLFMLIHDEEDWLTETFCFVNHWYLDMLFHMAARLNMCHVNRYGDDSVYKVNKAVVGLLEAAYPNDDMGYESLNHLCTLHRCIAEEEVSLGNDESIVRKHLTRAAACAVKSIGVKAHTLTHPLLCGWKIADAPSDKLQIVRTLREELNWSCFDAYRQKDWFIQLTKKLNVDP